MLRLKVNWLEPNICCMLAFFFVIFSLTIQFVVLSYVDDDGRTARDLAMNGPPHHWSKQRSLFMSALDMSHLN